MYADAQQVPLRPTVLTRRAAVAITRADALNPEALLVRLSASGQRGDIRAWLHQACATPAEARTAATTKQRWWLHADEVPDLLLRWLRGSTAEACGDGGSIPLSRCVSGCGTGRSGSWCAASAAPSTTAA